MAETSSLNSILNTIKGKLDSALSDSNNHSEFTNNINVSSLANGFYTLNVNTNKGTQIQKVNTIFKF